MKRYSFLTLCFLQTFNLFAQDFSADRWNDNGDNTEINLPAGQSTQVGILNILKNANAQEEILKIKVSDSYNDFFAIRNATYTNNSFIPAIYAHNQTDSRISLSFGISTTPSNDYGNEPLLRFEARTYTNGETQSNPSSLINRPICAWSNLNVNRMLLAANGNLGIGTNYPDAQLHTTGSVKFSGLPTKTLNTVVQIDNNGVLSKMLLPTSAEITIRSTNATSNSLPRFGANNVIENSQISDDGINIGIGGLPATNAKVTVYGVVNTISDRREKSDIHKITNAIDKISHLNGYSYILNLSKEKQMGLIAQEVETIAPELISENSEGKKFLNYDGVIPLLLEALKEQQKIIESQSKRIEILELKVK